MLVMLLPQSNDLETCELLLGTETLEGINLERDWYRELGEFREADSRRLYKSPAPVALCSGGPLSIGGDEARLFWPVVAPGEHGSGRPEYPSI
jgi:hypothetical protein